MSFSFSRYGFYVRISFKFILLGRTISEIMFHSVQERFYSNSFSNFPVFESYKDTMFFTISRS